MLFNAPSVSQGYSLGDRHASQGDYPAPLGKNVFEEGEGDTGPGNSSGPGQAGCMLRGAGGYPVKKTDKSGRKG